MLASLTFAGSGGFGLAAILGAVVGATLAVGGGALLATLALVSGFHVAMMLGLLAGNGLNISGVGGLGGLVVVVASSHGEHSHSSKSGEKYFLHFFDVFYKIG
jgi:hypothetical protein